MLRYLISYPDFLPYMSFLQALFFPISPRAFTVNWDVWLCQTLIHLEKEHPDPVIQEATVSLPFIFIIWSDFFLGLGWLGAWLNFSSSGKASQSLRCRMA